ncbi:hypothetical protein WN943_010315 [Citrus x changshan-huyou]
MEFTIKGKRHVLKGAIAGPNKLVETSQVKHLLQQSNDRALAQLCSIYPNSALGTVNSEYLGRIISHERVTIDLENVAGMQAWPQLTSLKSLRGFLRLTRSYKRFFRDYDKISKPFTDLLKKDNFVWTSATTESFEQLRRAITTILVLAMSKVFVVECDASRSNIAVVLMQESNHISFISEAFSDKNLSLSTYEMELLEVVFAITKWRPYLVGQHFKGDCGLGRTLPLDLKSYLRNIMVLVEVIKEFKRHCTKSDEVSVGRVSAKMSTIVDRLSKYSHFIPLKHPYTALEVAQGLFNIDGTKLFMSFAYHSQIDGQIEVVNRCLEQYLRCMTGDSNVNSLHNSLQDLDKMTLLLRENLIQSQHRIKHIADAKHTDREFKVDDLVFLGLQPFRQPSIDLRDNRKLAPKYNGHFPVQACLRQVAYKLQLPIGLAIHQVFHVLYLKNKLGSRSSLVPHLTLVDADGCFRSELVAVLDCRMVKKNNKVVT